MTLIVGLRFGSGVLLAGDSVGVDGGGGAQMRRDPKVFALNRHVAIGYTSSYRMGQLLRFNVALPAIVDAVGDARKEDAFEWAVKEFIPAVRKAFSDGGYETLKDGSASGGYFLLAVRDRLFEICSDYQVAECVPAYAATGSGERYAFGALHALGGSDGDPWPSAKAARGSAEAALNAAVYHSAYVRPPYEFVETKA